MEGPLEPTKANQTSVPKHKFTSDVGCQINTQGAQLMMKSPESKTYKCSIDHFTVVCSVTWPLAGSKAGVDLVLLQTLLLLLCKTSCSDAN